MKFDTTLPFDRSSLAERLSDPALPAVWRRVRRRPYRVVTSRNANKVNELILKMARDDRGGWIMLKDGHEPEEGYRLQPGVILSGVVWPSMYSPTINIRPRFSDGTVFTLEDGVRFGPRLAWGGSQVANLQIDPQTPGLVAVSLEGGNGSEIRNVTSRLGRYPLLEGLRVAEGRVHDGQYSVVYRLRLTEVEHAVVWLKNTPDCVLSDSMFYGPRSMDVWHASSGLIARGNNLTVARTHFQFFAEGIDLDAKELKVHLGSWENAAQWPYQRKGRFAVRIGARADDVLVDSLSMANFASVDRVFDLPASMTGAFLFRHLTGHVGPRHVPAGEERHFQWIPE